MPGPVREPPAPPDGAQAWHRSHEAQRLRWRRFGLATLSYALFLGELWSIELAGFNITPPAAAFGITAAVIATNVALALVFRSGINLRLRDPSLTMLQVLIGFAFGMVGVGIAGVPAAQDVYLVTATIPMLYGMLGLRTGQLVRIAALVTGALVIVLAIHRLVLARPEQFRLDVLRVVAFGFVMLWVSWLAGYISRLRTRLAARNDDLRNALANSRRLAAEDELTELATRRIILQRIEELLAAKTAFTIALADLDHFKEVNDTLGHPAGDRVLRIAASRMRRNLRPGDEIGRYGGDEFLVVMPQTDVGSGRRIGERLRAAIAAEPIAVGEASVLLSASLGIVEVADGDTLETVLTRADRALYQAKDAGRAGDAPGGSA